MASKLETFLAENKIDPRRVVAASRQLERLRPEDRRIKLVQKQARKSEDGKKPEGLAKPRSGRAVTDVALRNALAGKTVSAAFKTRLLRALNRVLEQKKKGVTTLDALFDAPPPQAKAKAKAESDA
jgi:hypothetical protein